MSSSRELSARLLSVVAAFSIVLVRIPVLLGHRQALQLLTLGVLVLCVLWAVPRFRQPIDATVVAVIFAYVALLAVTLLRGAQKDIYGTFTSAVTESLTYFLIVAFAIALMASAIDTRERNERLLAIALAPAVYCAVNLVAWAGGLTGVGEISGVGTQLPASLLGYAGIGMTRVQFPLTFGVNSMGCIAGAGLAAAGLLIRRSDLPRWLPWTAAAACGACLLLGDSRAALAIAVVVIAACRLYPTAPRLMARWLPVITLLLLLLVIGALSVLSGGLSGTFSRGGDDFVTGTGRVYIWDAAWRYGLSNLGLDQLVGWGAAGHVSSGVSQHYAYLFLGTGSDPTQFTTHNLVIQTVLDSGYIGLAALIAAVWVACRRLRVASGPIGPLIAILCVLIASGGTEVSPSYGTQEALIAALLVLGVPG